MAASETLSSPSSDTPLTFPPSATSTSDQSFVTDTNKVFFNAVLATNSISVTACLFVITVYFFLRRHHSQVMSRTSLKLGVAMACSDTIYHSANLAGYGNIPNGFMCAFIGGWLFATTSFLSVFYACAIALNTQLVFVHNRIPDNSRQVYYLVTPPILALLISTPTLIAGVYGFDHVFQYCWYTTNNVQTRTVLVRIIMTWSLWLSVALLYLIFATILITYSLFSKTGPLSRIGIARYPKRRTSQAHPDPVDADTAAMVRAKRDIARRALTVRVLGYISVPVVCVFPGVIIDLIARARPDVHIPSVVTLVAAVTTGLMGTLNAVLLSFDPSVVAVLFWPRWRKKQAQEQERRRRGDATVAAARSRRHSGSGPPPSTRKPRLLADIEMAETKAAGDESQFVATTIHSQNTDEHGLESNGHSALPNTIDLEDSGTSTIGYNISDLVETYHGL